MTQLFKVHRASDSKIVLKDDRQLETLFKEIKEDQDFMIQWIEKNKVKTRLFLGDGLTSRIRDGRLILEAEKDLDENDENFKEDKNEEESDEEDEEDY